MEKGKVKRKEKRSNVHCGCHHRTKKKANSHIMLEKTVLVYAKLAVKGEQFFHY